MWRVYNGLCLKYRIRDDPSLGDEIEGEEVGSEEATFIFYYKSVLFFSYEKADISFINLKKSEK